MFKRCLVVLSVGMCVFGVLAASSAEAQKLKIGAAMSSFADKWQTYLQDGIRKFGEEHKEDCEIVMTDGKDDPATQLNQIESLLTQGVNAIVIVPVDISSMGPIVQKCKEANVKLVVVNRLPDKEILDQIDVYAGSDSIQAGIMQAEWVAAKMPEGGKVGILMGPLGQEAAMMRTKGNKDVFANFPNITVDIEAEGKWDRAKGMQITENWLQSNRGLKAIVCNNDEMAIGALLAAESAGIKDEDLIIAGVDATPDALEYLGKGLDVTVFQSASGQGYGGAEAAYKLLKGEQVEKMSWVPYELVTVENMDNYKSKQ